MSFSYPLKKGKGMDAFALFLFTQPSFAAYSKERLLFFAASTSCRVGRAEMEPFRLAVSPPVMLAVRMISQNSSRVSSETVLPLSNRAARKPPVKESPAAVVSTASTGCAGIAISKSPA